MQLGPYERKWLNPNEFGAEGPINNQPDPNLNSDDLKQSEQIKKLSQPELIPVQPHSSKFEILDLAKIFETKTVHEEIIASGLKQRGIYQFISENGFNATDFSPLIPAALSSDEIIKPIETFLDMKYADASRHLANMQQSYKYVFAPDLENIFSFIAYLPTIIEKLPEEKSKVVLGNFMNYIIGCNFGECREDESSSGGFIQFYRLLKILSSVKEDESIDKSLKSKMVDYLEDLLAVQLNCFTSWNAVEESLIGLAMHLKKTNTNIGLQRLVADILRNHDSMRASGESLLASNKYSGIPEWFATKKNLSLNSKSLSRSVIDILKTANKSVQFEHKLRAILNPETDEIKKDIWLDPVDSVLTAAENNSRIFLSSPILTTNPNDPDLKVPISLKLEDSNSTSLIKDLLEGFANKGFNNLVIDLDSLLDHQLLREIMDSIQGEGYTEREQKFPEHRSYVTDLIHSFIGSQYSSFRVFLQDQGCFKGTEEISLKFARLLALMDDIKTLCQQTKTKLEIINCEYPIDYVGEITQRMIETNSKTVCLTAKSHIPEYDSIANTDGLLFIKHKINPKDFKSIPKSFHPSTRSRYFIDSTHYIQNELAKNSGYGLHQTVATSTQQEPRIYSFYEKFVITKNSKYQEIKDKNERLFNGMASHTGLMPDFILTTINSDDNQMDELVPQDVPEEILV